PPVVPPPAPVSPAWSPPAAPRPGPVVALTPADAPPGSVVSLTPADIHGEGPIAGAGTAPPSTRSSVLFALPSDAAAAGPRRSDGLQRLALVLTVAAVLAVVAAGVGAGAYVLLRLGNRPAPVVEENADGAKPPTDKAPDPVRPPDTPAFKAEPFNFRYATP